MKKLLKNLKYIISISLVVVAIVGCVDHEDYIEIDKDSYDTYWGDEYEDEYGDEYVYLKDILGNEKSVKLEDLPDDALSVGYDGDYLSKTQNITINGVEFVMKHYKTGYYYDDTYYFMGETEVTQELFEAVMGYNPSSNIGEKLPVENLTILEAKSFCEALSSALGGSFSVPTYSDWSDAFGSSSWSWYEGNSEGKSHPVKQKSPNNFGLYDMKGNVGEFLYYDYNDYFNIYNYGYYYLISNNMSYLSNSSETDKYVEKQFNTSKLLEQYKSPSIGFRLFAVVSF